MSKFNVELKSLLHLGLSKPEFYSNRDLIYKIEKIMVRTDISDQLRKVSIRYKRNGYSLNVMRQSARLMINPITLRLFSDMAHCAHVIPANDKKGSVFGHQTFPHLPRGSNSVPLAPSQCANH